MALVTVITGPWGMIMSHLAALMDGESVHLFGSPGCSII